jgi:putative transposase
MTNYRRNFVPGGSYFFTVNLADRRSRLLTDHVEPLRGAFRYVQARHPFTVEATVVLPDHLHAIWTLPQEDHDFALRWRLIKSAFSRAIPGGEDVSKSRARHGERASGSVGTGSIPCATRRTSLITSITFTSIR